MFKKKNMSIFEKIDKYLTKLNHECVMSIFLDGYNGNDIFIRFDYCRDIMTYKVIWCDLKFFDEKKMDKYLNMQMITSGLANKLVDCLALLQLKDDAILNDKIIGDRVEIVSYQQEQIHEYIFDRFLPLEWEKLIDPIVIIFSYLPRSMEVILNEMFGKFDGLENKYNMLKPVRFNYMSDEEDIDFFTPDVMTLGNKLYKDNKIMFLEKVEDRYIGMVAGLFNSIVVVKEIDDKHVFMWCNCKKDTYCKHLYAALLGIRNKKFNKFYKVTYKGHKDEPLLNKISHHTIFNCYGLDGDNIQYISNDLTFEKVPILDHNGNCMFKVIEDDDELTFSKAFEKYDK